jgi:hypothetical protein
MLPPNVEVGAHFDVRLPNVLAESSNVEDINLTILNMVLSLKCGVLLLES